MKDYHSTLGMAYEEPTKFGFTTIEPLIDLYGRKWGPEALAFVHALRPTYVRVTLGEQTTDARLWRVTVTVDENDVIRHIEQEVEVGLVDDWCHGGDASKWLEAPP